MICPVFPLFAKPGQTSDSPDASFRWISPALGPKRTCLHGIHLTPTASKKVAVFDLDGTLIKAKAKASKSAKSTPSDWEWWKAIVPQKLKEVHDSGSVLICLLGRVHELINLDPPLS